MTTLLQVLAAHPRPTATIGLRCLRALRSEPIYSLNPIVFQFPIITILEYLREDIYPPGHFLPLPAASPRLTSRRSYSPAPVSTWTPLRPRRSVVPRCLFP